MLIRVRSNAGIHRIEVNDNDTLGTLKQKLISTLSLSNEANITKSPSGADALTTDKDKIPLSALGIKHGDMLYLTNSVTAAPTTSTAAPASPATAKNEVEVEEDEVDKQLRAMDGWIPRPMTSKCGHGPNGRCGNCMPIAPWNITEVEPFKSEGISWIPFHSYMRKVQASNGCNHPAGGRCLNCRKSTFDQPSYQLKPCSKHPPWPLGICTDCDPGTVILNSQPWRHVDRVEFENPAAIDTFLQGWRDTGLQRCGYLYGKYTPDDHIPLGIRAMVMGIYEPPQKSTKTTVTLEPDPNEQRIDELAALLGLQRMGFIWTDLQTDPKTGKLIHNREDIKFTSVEMVRMAKLQNKYPSPCTQSHSGTCGSKFVSVLVKANANGEVELDAGQASNQCMALVANKIITANPEHLDWMRKKDTTKRYVPNIIYNTENEYGRAVSKKAEPYFPFEFFILPVAHSAPAQPKPIFKHTSFPSGNRLAGTAPSLAGAKAQIDKLGLAGLSDFRLLVFLASQLDKASLQKIAAYLKGTGSEAEVRTVLNEVFKTVKPAATPAPAPSPSPSPSPTSNRPPQPVTTAGRPSQPAPVTRPAGLNAKQLEMVRSLVSMGYQQQQAEEALRATNFNLDDAIDLLLAM